MKNCKYPIKRNFFKTEIKCFLSLCKKYNLEVSDTKEIKQKNLSKSMIMNASLSGIPIFRCSIYIEQRFSSRKSSNSQYLGKTVTIVFDNRCFNYSKFIKWKQNIFKMENGKRIIIPNKKPKFRVIFNKIIKNILLIFNQRNIQHIMES